MGDPVHTYLAMGPPESTPQTAPEALQMLLWGCVQQTHQDTSVATGRVKH